MRVGPVGFLLLVAGGWAGVRTAMLWPEAQLATPPRVIAFTPPAPHAPASPAVAAYSPVLSTRPISAAPIARVRIVSMPTAAPPISSAEHQIAARSSSNALRRDAVAPPPPPPTPALIPSQPDKRFLSLSTWFLVRGPSSSTLAAAGQLGGSQAGARVRLWLGRNLHAAARVSSSLGGEPGAEAALALDWRPSSKMPVTFTVERRVGIDRGGRDAFAVGVFGGVDQVRLPAGFRLDGYGQAGVVGLRRRDPYVDGAIRADREFATVGPAGLAVGAGVWGGAQPGASRLDLGPQLIVRMPVAQGSLRFGAEWRQRVAGNARPGSGPALSLGADF